MANYREENLTGSKWTRANRVVIENPVVGDKAIAFYEEAVALLSDGLVHNAPAGILREPFVDPAEVFQLRNPMTDEVIPGATATYQDVYVMLHSLYLHLAEKRDVAAAAPLPAE